MKPSPINARYNFYEFFSNFVIVSLEFPIVKKKKPTIDNDVP